MGRPSIHGETTNWGYRSTEYRSWSCMRSRCNNSNDPDYKRYGGAGIGYVDAWEDFGTFLANMGRKPSRKHTLGRIDHGKDYGPDNCKWVTPKEQGRVKSNVILTMKKAREIRMLWNNGYSQKDLSEEFGVSQSQISRIVNHKRWEEGE